MTEQDPAVTRRTVLGGVAIGGSIAAGLAATGALRWVDQPAAAPPQPPKDKIDRPRPRVSTAPDGSIAVHPPRRDFYSRASASGGQTFGDLILPVSATPKIPVVVMIHGGGWAQQLGLDYMEGMARDLASFDVAVWNVEYRRVGSGGGWPTTVSDVCDAVDHLAALAPLAEGRLDLNRVAVIGHSSGAHLALWAAGRPALADPLPGSRPAQRVVGAVTLAGVSDLLRAEATGDQYVHAFLGGTPKEVRQRYVDASPIQHLPTGIPVVCLHGAADKVVPPEQSQNYVREARRLGDPARLEIVPGGRHDPWGDLKAEPWKQARGILLGMLANPAPANPVSASHPAPPAGAAVARPSSVAPAVPAPSAPSSTRRPGMGPTTH